MRACWNRQTGTFEGRVSTDVWVQVPLLAPFILPDCVKVARQTLTLFVWVRILVRQPEKAVKIDAICFDRILMRFLSIFEKFDLTKKQ